MGSFSFRRNKSARQLRRHRPLRAEALEGRAMLTAIAPLPCSVVLLGQSSNILPPDPVVQFSPQPMVAAATTNTAVHWQGHATERLVETAADPTSTAPPAAWLVDVVYNLNGQPAPTPTPGGATWAFDLSGTVRETLTRLSATAVPVSSAQVWVSNENVTTHIVVSPSPLASPVPSYAFTTDSTINQRLAPLAAVAGAPTTLPTWIANTTTHTTGIIVTPLLGVGTLSFQEQIDQTLTPVSATGTTTAGWTIAAEFDAAGSFKEVTPVASPAVVVMPSGTLSLTGTLTGSVSPPSGMGMPTQLFNHKVTANVAFTPLLTATPLAVLNSTPLSGSTLATSPGSLAGTPGKLGPSPLVVGTGLGG